MSHFWTTLTQGTKNTAGSFTPGQYSVGGKKVTCPHCGNERFAAGTSQIPTAGLTFVGLEWAEQTAYTLLCSNCGRIEWYMQEPVRL